MQRAKCNSLHALQAYNCDQLDMLILTANQLAQLTANWLAQLVEGRITVREVSGSSPRPHQHSGSLINEKNMLPLQ